MINTSIGKYTITRKIGEGGMASVYEARHEMLGTKVAIKVLNPILSANEQIRERFKNEAKLMASLNHKNITRIIDFDEQPNQLSIILEFLEGEDLDEKIKRQGALPDEEILSIFKQAFAAFQYAHEKGIVHRDIKPSNIYILPDGRVKILDFGIAKLFGEGNEMTKTGTQMGTPIYMSPEQVKGDKYIDYRSDIYSLGITLYAAIVGKPPYDATTESQFEIFNKIVFEPIRGLGIENKYNDIVAKACNKDREQRFQSCEEWLKAMNNLGLASGSTPLKPVAPITDKTIIDNINLAAPEDTISKVDIGSQTWMTYNLDVTHFRNGDEIPEVKSAEEWRAAGEKQQAAWCYYDNDASNGSKYGKLYNWYAVNDLRGLAPEGWHIPTDTEWTTLSSNLGGEDRAGTKMKSSSGWSENGNGTNSGGFLGLPGGARNGDGDFSGNYGYWWSASVTNGTKAWGRSLGSYFSSLYRAINYKGSGFSVRCVENYRQ